jgi:hypothetical protein
MRKRKEEPVFGMSLDELENAFRQPIKPKPCFNCGKLCANWIRGELHYPYCSDDCMREAGDHEPIT